MKVGVKGDTSSESLGKHQTARTGSLQQFGRQQDVITRIGHVHHIGMRPTNEVDGVLAERLPTSAELTTGR